LNFLFFFVLSLVIEPQPFEVERVPPFFIAALVAPDTYASE
jgi:hypothetical protein